MTAMVFGYRRRGFSPNGSYVAARDFLRGKDLVKKGEPVLGSICTLRRFFRQRLIDPAPTAPAKTGAKKDAKPKISVDLLKKESDDGR